MRIVKIIFAFFLDIIETVVVAASIFVIIYLFFAQPHQVIGNSMIPNFHDKEFILTDKISYRLRVPQRGEVIVFKSPEDNDKDFIKRIIGLPGERIKLQNGRIFINGGQLTESYLDPNLETHPSRYLPENTEITIALDMYIVLGDNRSNSSDSRAWGALSKSAIIGRALLIYWPPQNFQLIEAVDYR